MGKITCCRGAGRADPTSDVGRRMHSALAIRARATALTAQLPTWRIVIRSSVSVLDPALILDIEVELGGAVMRTSGPLR